MEEVGSFTGMEVKERGGLAICQRVASLRLYAVKIQLVNKEKQTISFDPIGVKSTEDEPFKISALASSGLALSYSLVSGPAELVNDTVKLSGKVGVVNILVSQEGNNEFHPVAVNMTFYVSRPGSLDSSVPVTGLLICCRGTDRGPFLVNGQWKASHDYSDINQVRGILTHIQNAGINVVCIDMTNPSQWTRLWDMFSPMVENIRTVCAEKNMEYFVMIGAVVSDAVRAGTGMPDWIKTIGHLEFWNMQAQYIWENWAQDSHYRRYGFGDDRKIINMFYPGILVQSLWNTTPDEDLTYLSKFYRGTHEYNEDFTDTPSDGWGYRDIQQSSNGNIRFVSPTAGLVPSTSTRISAQQWADRIDWAADAAHYSIYGSYDDNNDNIHWGINDTKNATGSIPLKYPENDPYYYYSILKNKLTSSPEVSFIQPLHKDTFELEADIVVEVSARDDDGISMVSLFLNETLIGQDSVAPYKWGPGNSMFQNLRGGNYTLKAVAIDMNGTTATTTISFVVEPAVGISKRSAMPDKNLIKLYPNPAKELLNFQFSNAGVQNTGEQYAEVIIYSIIGERVMSQPISDSHSSINIKLLPAGVYISEITQKNNIQINRFIKN